MFVGTYMLITADQIRAARALKNWSQTDLAERTGLAVPTIANIELGKQIPGKNTIEKIIDAFSIGGIRFTSNGVEFDKDEIFSLVGEGKFKNLLSDAIRTLDGKPPKEREFLAMNAEDILTSDEETSLHQEMLKKGISLKRIVSNKSDIFYNEFDTRIIEHKYSDDKGAFFVFADKVALYTAAENGQEPSTLIITNSRIAETYKKIFSYMWDSLKDSKPETSKKKGRK